jgi:pyridoxamine 5'-phosphate oxidase
MANPFDLFNKWYAEVNQTTEVEPQSMVVSTVDASGRPSSRVVFLREIIDGVYYFFTNYGSRKSQAIAENPHIAVSFHWRLPEHRQVHIEGTVAKASTEISEAYFRGRPRGSQIGAWASPQSQKIRDRAELEARVKMFEEKFAGRDVPLPEFWGGFGIVPERFEFWQAGEYRLHTRRVFTKTAKNTWEEILVSP